ncbi:MAG: hypothetical protein ACI4CC_03600 [Lachnospiraceae bacterium]
MSIFEYDEELHAKFLREEGREEGYKDGYNNGYDNGKWSTIVMLICQKLKAGQAAKAISHELGVELDTVNRICEIAAPYAPDYDINAIVDQLQSRESVECL